MKYNLSRDNDILLFDNQVKYLREFGKMCEVKEVKKTRSPTQNASLHLWFDFISESLNDNGETFHYSGISGKEFEMPFTSDIIKSFVIKPIILTMFNIESTTKLTTEMINKLIDVINKFMGNKGIYLPFPSIESLNEYNK